MEILLLNVIGSAAVASAIIAGAMSTRLSKELAGSAHDRSDSGRGKPVRGVFKVRP